MAPSTLNGTLSTAGGGGSGKGVYTVTGTAGQPDANIDLMTDSSTEVQGGFWVVVLQPDLTITKQVSPTAAVAGQTITYTLTFSNVGGNGYGGGHYR